MFKPVFLCSLLVVASLGAPSLRGEAAITELASTSQAHVVEIRSYNLKPGTRDRFQQTFVKEALPVLKRWKVDVVSYGPSQHDQDSWFLMRAFNSVDERQKEEDAFYGSDEWKLGPRERILADIVSYTTVVISVDDRTLQGLRNVK